MQSDKGIKGIGKTKVFFPPSPRLHATAGGHSSLTAMVVALGSGGGQVDVRIAGDDRTDVHCSALGLKDTILG